MIYLKRTTAFFLIFTFGLIIFSSVELIYNSTNVFNKQTDKVIIDAGHGLPDGGALAPDGTLESDLNLSISLKLEQYLLSAGIECILTRKGSESIYAEGETIHAKKVSDTRERVRIASEHQNSILISLHMNTFPSESVHGAQVFYKSNSDKSKKIAEEIQRIINLKFQPENIKKIKPIPSNVYLFNNIKNDCILVECGFLTNAQDLEKLKSDTFQNDLAKAIAEIIIYNSLGSENNGK